MARLVIGRHRFEKSAVNAILHDIDIGLAKLIADEDGVFRAHGHHAVRLVECPALETLEGAPLPFQEPAFGETARILEITLPDEGVHIVRDQQPPTSGSSRQQWQMRGPLELPEVHLMGGRVAIYDRG